MGNKNSKTLTEYLVLVSKILAKLKSKKTIDSYGLIGGLAISTLGLPRATKDIDFLVSTKDVQNFYHQLKKVFHQKRYVLELKKPEFDVFPFYAIICYLKEKKGKDRIIDFIIVMKQWQDEISKDVVEIEFEGQKIPIVNTEGLIVLKLSAGSPLDIIDIKNILKIVDIKKLNQEKLSRWLKDAKVDKLFKRFTAE